MLSSGRVFQAVTIFCTGSGSSVMGICRLFLFAGCALRWVSFCPVASASSGDVKSYAHFDKRVSLRMERVRQYIMEPRNIITHGFYPFIHFLKKEKRYGKKEGIKKRHLHYSAHLDCCIYQRYAFLINYRYNLWAQENGVSDVAIAYRDNLQKNNIDFAKDAFIAISRFAKCFVMIGDFTDFFDSLDHAYLKRMLCKVLSVERLPDDYFAVFKNITHFASWDWKDLIEATGESICERKLRKKLNGKTTIITKEQFCEHKRVIFKNNTTKGIPQGSPISAVLSNVYMIEVDKQLKKYVDELGGVYMRYSDDFIIILPYSNKGQCNLFYEHIFSYFESLNALVKLQNEKTHCYIYQNGLVRELDTLNVSSINYLGFIFNGQTSKIRPRAITKYYYRMRRKARTIGMHNWKTFKGRHISAENLYEIYSDSKNKNTKKRGQNFISYARRAKGRLKLVDPETDSLIKNNKRKIARAIKEGSKRIR